MKKVEDMTFKEISDYCKEHTCYQCASENTALRYFCIEHFLRHHPFDWFEETTFDWFEETPFDWFKENRD